MEYTNSGGGLIDIGVAAFFGFGYWKTNIIIKNLPPFKDVTATTYNIGLPFFIISWTKSENIKIG